MIELFVVLNLLFGLDLILSGMASDLFQGILPLGSGIFYQGNATKTSEKQIKIN